MRRLFTLLCLTLCLTLCLSAAVPTAAAQDWGESENVVSDFEEAAEHWRSGLVSYASYIAGALAVIELLLSIMWLLLKKKGRPDIGIQLAFKFAFLAFLSALIFSFDFWFPPIIRLFMGAGAAATGSSVLQPGQVFYHGFTLLTTIMEAYEFSLWSIGFRNLMVFIAALGIITAYLYIAVKLALTLVYSIILLAIGPFLLSSAALQATAGIAEGFVRKFFEIALKLFLLQVVIALGTSLTLGWLAILQNAGALDLGPIAQVGIGVAIFTAVVAVIPDDLAHTATTGLDIPFARWLRG